MTIPPEYRPIQRPKSNRLTVEQLQDRLRDARAKLRVTHHQANKAREQVEEKRTIADRAAEALAAVQAELRSLRDHDADAEREFVTALREGRPPSVVSNGINRSEIEQRLKATESASTTLTAELAEANRVLAETLNDVKAAARAVIAAYVSQSTDTLRTLESVAARLRCELLAVAETRFGNGAPLLSLDHNAADYIATPPINPREHPDAYGIANDVWLRQWRKMFDRLLDGECDAQFDPNSLPTTLNALP